MSVYQTCRRPTAVLFMSLFLSSTLQYIETSPSFVMCLQNIEWKGISVCQVSSVRKSIWDVPSHVYCRELWTHHIPHSNIAQINQIYVNVLQGFPQSAKNSLWICSFGAVISPWRFTESIVALLSASIMWCWPAPHIRAEQLQMLWVCLGRARGFTWQTRLFITLIWLPFIATYGWLIAEWPQPITVRTTQAIPSVSL